MAYIIGIYASILALGIWKENLGSGRSEGGLGSERCPGCKAH